MKRLTAGFFVLFFVVSCSGDPQRDTLNTLISLENAIESTANVTANALRQGHITVKQACVVEQYGRLAQDAVYSAYLNFGLGNPESTQEYIQAAKDILARTSIRANILVEDNCAGNP